MSLSVVILAGGFGTRIETVANGLPKALIEVNEKPLLLWKINQLLEAGVNSLVISTGFRGNQIYDLIEKNEWAIPIALVPDGPKPIGTLGAIRRIARFTNTSHLLVTYGDNLLDFNPEKLLKLKLPFNESIMVLTRKCGPSERYNTRVQDNKIALYSKNPNDFKLMNSMEYGYSLLSVYSLLQDEYSFEFDLGNFFSTEIENNRMNYLETDKKYWEIGTPEGLDALRKHLLKQQAR